MDHIQLKTTKTSFPFKLHIKYEYQDYLPEFNKLAEE